MKVRQLKIGGLLLMAIACGCQTKTELTPIVVADVPEYDAAYKVALLIWNTPSWYSEDDPMVRKFILRRDYEISLFSDQEVRDGVLMVCEWIDRLPSNLQDQERAKIALLSRLIYAVPDLIPAADSKSGDYTWLLRRKGIDPHQYLAIPPLATEANGDVVILISTNTFTIPPSFINVVAELEHVSKKYGRANLVLKGDGYVLRELPRPH
jgi:hypothetical protein